MKHEPDPLPVAGERPQDHERKDQGLPVSHSAQSDNQHSELAPIARGFVMPATTEHPNTRRAFKEAATRWNDLKSAHRTIADRLWAGTMATEFTPFELSLLKREGYLSERDWQLLMLICANSDWS